MTRPHYIHPSRINGSDTDRQKSRSFKFHICRLRNDSVFVFPDVTRFPSQNIPLFLLEELDADNNEDVGHNKRQGGNPGD